MACLWPVQLTLSNVLTFARYFNYRMHFTPASKHYQSMTISSDSCNMALLIMSRGYTSLLKLKVCYGNHLQKKA
ncbi:hypothetical protein T10_13011 [Trichinella papuae]|uniref:Uncharacterized protein n=1 Tax=Trichinella papuae TaxID=268474 RepID=A0A0V1M4I1_9BILA|nr:hypothetical protein T10_13011 [Trichinella papuae]